MVHSLERQMWHVQKFCKLDRLPIVQKADVMQKGKSKTQDHLKFRKWGSLYNIFYSKRNYYDRLLATHKSMVVLHKRHLWNEHVKR